MRRLSVAIASSALAVSACGNGDTQKAPLGGDEDEGSNRERKAQQLCQGPGLEAAQEYGTAAAVERAYPTTREAFARWLNRDRGSEAPSAAVPGMTAAPESFLALCYFGGTFNSFPEPAAATMEPPPPQDLIGLVLDETGSATFYVAAQSATYDIDDKPDAR